MAGSVLVTAGTVVNKAVSPCLQGASIPVGVSDNELVSKCGMIPICQVAVSAVAKRQFGSEREGALELGEGGEAAHHGRPSGEGGPFSKHHPHGYLEQEKK